MTITPTMGTFVRFQSAIQFEAAKKKPSKPATPPASNEKPKEKKVPIPRDVNKQLKAMAELFKQPLKKAQDMYRNLRGLEILKDLTNQEILNIVKTDLDPAGPKMSTAAMGEEGGNWPKPTPPKMVTQA
ncbi:MAG: hypothetical protein K2X66_10740, partial [Cyanobacteria bacterium]|nr:hypothetical protein [Cyanobacteriota bacterium]